LVDRVILLAPAVGYRPARRRAPGRR